MRSRRRDPHGPAQIRSTRRVISSAARRVKVSSRMRLGSAPRRIRWATRCASVLVLPEPAPAMIRSGRPGAARPSGGTSKVTAGALRLVQPPGAGGPPPGTFITAALRGGGGFVAFYITSGRAGGWLPAAPPPLVLTKKASPPRRPRGGGGGGGGRGSGAPGGGPAPGAGGAPGRVSARRAGHHRGSPERPGQRRRMADVRARLPQPALQPARPDHARQRQGPAPVWAFSTGGKLAGLEATPLMRDGVLYFSTDYSRVFALDARTGHRPVVVRARVRGGAGDHALLRPGQPRRRAQGRSGLRQYPRCPPLGARPQGRQRGLGADHRRLEEGGDRDRRAARGRRQGDRRHRRRRVRRARLPQGLRRRDRRAAVADLHHPRSGRARQRDLAGRHLDARRRHDLADRRLRRRDRTRCSGAPATPAPGTRTCGRATTCGAARCWRSTPTPARSSGATSTRPTTPGTTTATTPRS